MNLMTRSRRAAMPKTRFQYCAGTAARRSNNSARTREYLHQTFANCLAHHFPRCRRDK